ncbi:dUTP diphosphatase [Rhizobium ruizarguesonis]|uniref:dUTP diphosphatase n=1 Tax=Rhizobium TaxID=379 RepID=UPI00296213B9|nr:dUTP diphosphatase [Rhizobium ruizarguesonis]
MSECVQIRPRSGLAANHGITVLNSPATIDSDYRGEIKVILHNASDAPFLVKSGDRVAQIVFASVLRAQFDQTGGLSHSVRAGDGFGSTGP